MKRGLLPLLLALGLMSQLAACESFLGGVQAERNVWGNLKWGMSEAQARQAYPACRFEHAVTGELLCDGDMAYLAGEAFAVRVKFSLPAEDNGAKEPGLSEMRFTPIKHSAGLGGRLTSSFQDKYGRPRSASSEIDGRVTIIWTVRAMRTKIVINATKGEDSTMTVGSVVYTRMGKTAGAEKDDKPKKEEEQKGSGLLQDVAVPADD